MTSIRSACSRIKFLPLLLAVAALLYACTASPRSPSSDAGNREADAARGRSEAPADGTDGGIQAPVDEQESPPGLPLLRTLDAKSVLSAGLAEADRTKRLVFLHSGASW